jgi:hypothetical protein
VFEGWASSRAGAEVRKVTQIIFAPTEAATAGPRPLEATIGFWRPYRST